MRIVGVTDRDTANRRNWRLHIFAMATPNESSPKEKKEDILVMPMINSVTCIFKTIAFVNNSFRQNR